MAFNQANALGNQKVPQVAQRQMPALQERLLDPNMREWTCTYRRGDGTLETKTLLVPKFLVAAIHNPGEQGMDALQVMKALTEFFNKEIATGLETVNLGEGLDVPASILSALIHRSYEVHACIVATDKGHSKDLFLDDPEVRRLMRITASKMTGKQLCEIVELNLDDTTITVNETTNSIIAEEGDSGLPDDMLMHDIGGGRVLLANKDTADAFRQASEIVQKELGKEKPDEGEDFMNRNVTKTILKPTVRLETKSMMCDMGSHKEPKDVSVPMGTSVDTSQEIREERLRRMPDVEKSLDNVFGEIEKKRKGPLDLDERNAVVQRINLSYVENPLDRLPVIPKLNPDSKAGW
ncbi:MAG: hypothetical protein NTX79_07010 [Candidatus Micrarchaeota archaeon]|nr:hypothetical protein [Candidatus Micrarchaeota archaeon]